MANIYFTQYLRPDGRKTAVMIDRPDYIAKAADFIRSNGFRFEIEELSTGQVSMTISDDEDDYHRKICDNGPDVPATVDELIKTFDMGAAIKRRKELMGA
jgi:sensor histidine kinase regulating citrate/malate metabolism